MANGGIGVPYSWVHRLARTLSRTVYRVMLSLLRVAQETGTWSIPGLLG
jgi:hypothetical protein